LETIRRDVLNLSRAFLFKTLSPVALALPVLTSCSSPQSAFNGAGTEADSVINLFYVMLAGSVAIWLFVVGLSFYAVRTTPAGDGARIGVRLIIWGDCVFPTVVLALLLFWGLGKMPDYRRPADGPTIAVSGERFWWRVAYDVQGDPGIVKSLPPGGVESANELWIPVGRRTQILLGSPDVIHSFWVPALAGKTDAIPGRVNRIVLEPIVEGVYFGVCAELCGDAHAQMGLRVVAVPEAEYAAHVAAQAERQPSSRDAGSRRSSRTAAAPATPYGEPRPMARSVPTSPMSPPASPSPRDFWRPPRRTSPPSSARPIM
jgi:cytochrome c oxidase subunit 2